MTSMLAFLASNYFATGKLPLRTGNDHALASPYGLFEASDGQIAVAPSNDTFYFKLLDALDLGHLRDHPDFLTNDDRYLHRGAINAEINARTREKSVAHWIAAINRAGVPCGRVLDMAQVFDDPQTRHQQMRISIEHPQHGRLDVLGFPIKFSDAPCQVHRVPPLLGGDTDALLGELGFDAAGIAGLRGRGIV
jgi:crotonobetainyl-CoA:carnitine CoA-transferase CaiB-like acyl-CoA transferase